MSAELERRLRRAFDRLPEPGRDVSARTRSTALAAIPRAERRRAAWPFVLVAAAAAVVGLTAAALAATGNLHVDLGGRSSPAPRVPTRLVVPAGTNGIAVVAGGKLWLATRRGLRIEGMPVSTAELSPRGLFAAVGIGSSLVALAPGQRRAWTHDAGGRIVAIAWSPDGLKIAYVTRGSRGAALHMIEGDGDNDRLLDPRVAAEKPSWRADSLAIAYVRPAGLATVYDLGSGRRRSFDTRRCGGRARAVAYAPGRPRLAVAGGSGVALVERWNTRPTCVAFDRVLSISGLAWAGPRRIVTSDNPRPGIGADSALRWYDAGRHGIESSRTAFTPRLLRTVTSSPRSHAVAVVIRRGPRELDLAVAVGSRGARMSRLNGIRPLLRLRVPPAPVSISWR